jgi:hypothetical protein
MNTRDLFGFEVPTGAVCGEIEFLVPTKERAYSYGYEPGEHEPPATAIFAVHEVAIRNARLESKQLSLDEHGATLIAHRSNVQDYYDDAQLTGVYYPESAAVIKAATGADRVVVFDHNVRRGLSLKLRTNRYNQGRPVLHAHTDFTPASAERRLRNHLGAEAMKRPNRVLQVNLWRPIRAPLRDYPLAICDSSSLGPDHLRAVDLVYPDRRGEIYYLTYDPAQRWYYAPDMQVNETWLLKNYDSATSGTPGAAAHCAFNEPSRGLDIPPRESIEVRAFALFGA